MASMKKGDLKTGRFTINSIQHSDHPESDHSDDHPKQLPPRSLTQKLEPERPRKEESRPFKHAEASESDKSVEIEPRHDLSQKPRIGSSMLSSAPSQRHLDKHTMTSEESKEPQHKEPRAVHGVLDLCFAFQETLGAKFTEMLNVHKDIMLELMTKERNRDDQLRRLTQDLSELHLHNARLQMENKYLCDVLTKQKDCSL
jgi:hypothetical protein